MTKYLITGVSSGIGRNLTKMLVNRGNIVWGIARREVLLKTLEKELHSKRFIYRVMDQAENSDWNLLVKYFSKKRFTPDIIIFNAAIQKFDLENGINIDFLEKSFEVNFLGVMKGINYLLTLVKPKSQFIAISTFSALKGSSLEGVGYAASKAALSIGFESLYQKYKKRGILFKTIFFGPVNSGMGPFKKSPFVLSEEEAVQNIIRSIRGAQGQYYYPATIFTVMKLIKLLPSSIYFKILSVMESIHSKFQSHVN